jgi:hypothetical protein
VCAGGAFGTDEQKEELHRLGIERVELQGLIGDAGRHDELIERGRLAVRDRHAGADAGAEDHLALAHGREHRVHDRGAAIAHGKLHELAEHLVLGPAAKRDLHPVLGEQLAQKHSGSVWCMRRGTI